MVTKTVAAIIERKGKILLIKRSSDMETFPEYWSLPGGKIDTDKDETPKKAIKREVKEETNLNFAPEKLLGKYRENFPHYNWKAEVFVFTGSFSGKLKHNKESSELKWFSKEEIENIMLAFDHKVLIREHFDSK